MRYRVLLALSLLASLFVFMGVASNAQDEAAAAAAEDVAIDSAAADAGSDSTNTADATVDEPATDATVDEPATDAMAADTATGPVAEESVEATAEVSDKTVESATIEPVEAATDVAAEAAPETDAAPVTEDDAVAADAAAAPEKGVEPTDVASDVPADASVEPSVDAAVESTPDGAADATPGAAESTASDDASATEPIADVSASVDAPATDEIPKSLPPAESVVEPATVEVPEAVAAEPVATPPEEAAPETASAVEPAAAAVEPAPVKATVAVKPVVSANVAGQEQMRRKALEMHGLEMLKLADKSYMNRNFEQAAKQYGEAIKNIGVRAATKKDLDRAKKAQAESYYQAAVQMRKAGDAAKAEEYAKKALEKGHPAAAKLLQKITGEKNQPVAAAAKKDAPVWEQPEYKQKQQTVSGYMRKAKEYLAVNDLDAAQQNVESALKRDPYNSEAIRLRDKIVRKRTDRASAEAESTRAQMMADQKKAWNPGNYGVLEEPKAVDRTGEQHTNLEPSIQILKLMEEIKISEIDFRAANIQDVVEYLQRSSVDAGKPINFVLTLDRAPSAALEAPVEGDASADAPASTADDTTTDLPAITFKAHDVSLLEALKVVTDVSNLKFTIQGRIVMIMRKGAEYGPMTTRTYEVLPTFSPTTYIPGGDQSADGGEESTTLGANTSTGERSDWKIFFGQLGVLWPENSSISYVPAIGRLVVKNTPDNLVEFERILAMLNVAPSQIEIEARFVEVRQTDMNELGFEWNLTDDWEVATKKDSAGNSLGDQQMIQVKAGGFTAGNRFASTSMGVDAPQDTVMTVASVLTNPELEFVIHALEQKGNADLLSAPKVTTQSGVEAQISVATEYIYPTEFTVTPITATINTTAMIVGGTVEPSSFDKRDVGVILKVTPEVSADRSMINLAMTPEVISLAEWHSYGSTYTDINGLSQQLAMDMPFFQRRSVQTTVSIYNGATVVMGGMINEKRVTVDDKIPFFGDIPLLGRLFRSKYESSEKQNLVVFVTARLVDPAGRPLKRQQDIIDTIADKMAKMSGTASAPVEAVVEEQPAE